MLNEPLFKSANPPRYIAIEGPIGVGKTTLMQRLSASLEYSPVPEGAEENPFLERFYDNRRHGALAAQLAPLTGDMLTMADIAAAETRLLALSDAIGQRYFLQLRKTQSADILA